MLNFIPATPTEGTHFYHARLDTVLPNVSSDPTVQALIDSVAGDCILPLKETPERTEQDLVGEAWKAVKAEARRIYETDPSWYRGHRIDWIKTVRSATNCSLIMAKDATDLIRSGSF